MVNYENGKVYCIRSHKTDMIYIGSTTLPLSQRLAKHNSCYKELIGSGRKTRLPTSTKIIEQGDAYIELLENCPCQSKEQLFMKEAEWIRKTPNCVNIQVPTQTMNEYNKSERGRNRKHRYRANPINRERELKQSRERKSQLYKCSCGKELTLGHKSRHEKTEYHRLHSSGD